MATVLVVEDSLFQRKFLQGILEGSGYDVLEAKNGSEGVAKATRLNPDIILLDLMMPNFTGMQMLEWIQERKLPIPVVVVSADIQESTRTICLAMGAVAFISKPVHPPELHQTMETILHPNGADQP